MFIVCLRFRFIWGIGWFFVMFVFFWWGFVFEKGRRWGLESGYFFKDGKGG